MKAEIIQAQREIIQGYYTKIGFNPNVTVEDIMQMLEDDLQYIREETLLLDAENIISAPIDLIDPHEVSKVKCDVCGYVWVAVRPLGVYKLECPKCGGVNSFENEM